jgi:hypothetical protein
MRRIKRTRSRRQPLNNTVSNRASSRRASHSRLRSGRAARRTIACFGRCPIFSRLKTPTTCRRLRPGKNSKWWRAACSIRWSLSRWDLWRDWGRPATAIRRRAGGAGLRQALRHSLRRQCHRELHGAGGLSIGAAAGSALLPTGPRGISQARDSRSERRGHHAFGFRQDAIQLFRDFRSRQRRRDFHLHLSPTERAQFRKRGDSVGHADGMWRSIW